MICTCANCRHAFWRYRRDHPPRGFCSTPCLDFHRSEKEARRTSKSGPGIPRAILELQRSHLRIVHHCNDKTAWFETCAECERLEEKYAAALAYHLPAPAAPDNQSAATRRIA